MNSGIPFPVTNDTVGRVLHLFDIGHSDLAKRWKGLQRPACAA